MGKAILTETIVPTRTDDVRPWITTRNRSLAIRERQVILILGDVFLLIVYASLVAAVNRGPGNFFDLAVPLLGLWLIAGTLIGIYDVSLASRTRSALMAIGQAGAAIATLLLLLFFLHPFRIDRSSLLAIASGAPLLLGAWRFVYIAVVGAFERRVLILGAGDSGATLMEAIRTHPGHGVSVIGILDDDPMKHGESIAGVPVLGTTALAWPLVRSHAVEQVVLAISRPERNDVLEALGECYSRGVPVALMPHVYEEVSGQVPIEHMGRHWIGAVPLRNAGGTLYEGAKRSIDVVLSGLALVLVSPILLAVALAVRLSSPGPVLFRQTRFGLHGKPFSVIKFRSMTHASSSSTVTSVGRWIRRMHLDELPQLWNVLHGDMSLVGPRPKRADEAEGLEQDIPLYRVRYSVRPGLTGWAQIRFRYAHNPEDELSKLRYDLYYVKHRSLLFDFLILARTATHVFGMRGF
jgi:exopolysaccharide biosynthesis polyprenyl glycosylphosphotransferase